MVAEVATLPLPLHHVLTWRLKITDYRRDEAISGLRAANHFQMQQIKAP